MFVSRQLSNTKNTDIGTKQKTAGNVTTMGEQQNRVINEIKRSLKSLLS